MFMVWYHQDMPDANKQVMANAPGGSLYPSRVALIHRTRIGSETPLELMMARREHNENKRRIREAAVATMANAVQGYV